MAENESAWALFQTALDSRDEITSEMLSREHLLQKIDYASKEQSQKLPVSLCPLGAELCLLWEPHMPTNMGPVMGSPSPMSQAECRSVIPLPCSGSPCSHPGTGQAKEQAALLTPNLTG